MIEVRILTDQDAEAYRQVRLAVLQNDPQAFVTTAEEFASRSLENIAEQLKPQDHAITFGTFRAGELVGILSIVRETRSSIRHRSNIYGVGVLPQVRGQGCGDALLQAAIAQAEQWEGVTVINLAVMETQQAAHRLYQRHDFVVWGTQPDAVRHGGRSLAEYWLWRRV